MKPMFVCWVVAELEAFYIDENYGTQRHLIHNKNNILS